MKKSICGADCGKCELNNNCKGCGNPFGGGCAAASCCENENCVSRMKKTLIDEINALGIADMEELCDLNMLCGAYINLEYSVAGGRKIKLLDDTKVYFGNQIHKKDGDRCYGIAVDEDHILICEYGEGGADAEIVAYLRRNR